MIEARGLVKRYGFAGKATTMRLIVGLDAAQLPRGS
jgi:hypothetical protein